MKNKKLIATVASLCLVLVAVVAAVVGVLAAAQQKVTNKIRVGYTAVANVYATVSLNGKTEQTGYGAEVEKNFVSADKSKEETLAFEYDAGLTLSESEVGGTNKYALYRFTFENQNPTHALEVTLQYKENSGADKSNVTLFWAKSSEDSWTPTLEYNDAGTLTTPNLSSSGGFDVTSGTDVNVYNHGNTAANQIVANTGAQAATTQYIYLVVAVTNLNINASYDLDGSKIVLNFVLDGYKA